ncbi:DEAD/DEAH box helicase [Cohnella sp. CFH 77786]|uniref:DEAD/DEAH box helicase n=1 Tax=Cohnella sp. CFH 77786 TaxID=2662265 RepID=UPI001C60F0AB|nr:DEAD/DEAH box helicase [Cohnella sp. CFH 77786]MBW5448430.1 DEAD/DEAH box helicase [Cohnella sp. CFH 77786]
MREGAPFAGMHPVLAEWFAGTFGEPTDVQRRSWDAIASGSHTLIAAPTGSGKTLAALLPCLNRLLEEKAASEGRGEKGVRILYITPLKALNNDIHHHVHGFVDRLDRLARETGRDWPGIRSAVRTGDTKPAERSAMLRRPPDLLVTTPESLYILLTSEKGREMLAAVRQVIVDEIHDLAADKRGSHLSLSLERLGEGRGGVQRIGVSATQKPLERVARFLGGWEEALALSGPEASAAPALSAGVPAGGECAEESFDHPLGYRPRPVRIVESDIVKRYRVVASIPDQNRPLQTREAAVWLPLLDRIMALIHGSRSVLIYVNSRRLCERLCLRLNDHVGYEMARAHHGSMSREWRLEVERMLKSGELRCIVATASLELGIDVGHVDFVIQIDPPPEAAAGIQRMGRAGHSVGDISRGAIVARNKGALPDIAVLSRMIRERDIEEIVVPRDSLDVLAQQTVAMVAERERTAAELHRLIARSDSYRSFPRERLDTMLEMLSGFYPFLRPLVDWDRESGKLTRRANTALAAVTGAGTIPQSSAYPVHHAESRAQIGELDEEFIHESRVGDVVQLGAQAWTIREIRHDRVYATEAGNRFSEIPFWRNESPARSYELGRKIGAFQRELEERLERPDGETADWLMTEYGMDDVAAMELIGYLRSQITSSLIPTDRRIVVEHYRDAANQKHVILHNHFGRKINRTWLLAIERQFEGMVPYRIYGNAKDNGIELVFSEWDVSWLHAIWQVTSANAERLLSEALTGSPLLAVSFRRIAETSLLLSRSFTRIPLWQKRLRGAELLKNALPYAERFPIFQEAMREAKDEYLDLPRLKEILEGIEDGRIEVAVRETEFPSPLAAQFLFEYVNMKMYEGDGIDESVQLQLLQLGKSAAGALFAPEEGLQAVDPGVMEEEERRLNGTEAEIRHADDLLRLLKRRGDLAEEEMVRLAGAAVREWLHELIARRRVADIRFGPGEGLLRWIAADEREIYIAFPASAESVAFVAGRFADNRISFTEAELIERYPSLTAESAASAVDTLLGQGLIEQAPFAADADERIWSSRKVAERLIRLSIGKARKNAEPVDPSRLLGVLLRRQRVLDEGGGGRRGEAGLLAAIEKLQGMFLPLSHWESIIFPSRIPDYRRETLDLLCASGQVIWLGRKDGEDKEGKIAFFLAENRALYEPWLAAEGREETRHPELLERLRTGGASFLTRLSQESGRLPSEVLADLLDLVWEGRVSNDQFAPLRQSARVRGKEGFLKAGSGLGRWYWTGSLLQDRSAAPAGADGIGKTEKSPIVRWIHHLLQTYGVLTKDLAARTGPYDWDVLLPALKKLEEWGAVTRGMFIRDLHVLQFTTRELAEEIRKPLPEADPSAVTLLASVDPANPYGQMADWPAAGGAAFARKPGNYLVLRGGRWLYWIENGGKRIYTMPDAEVADPDQPEPAAGIWKTVFSLLLKRQGLSKITVEKWNGEDVAVSPGGGLLRSLGAEKDRDRFVLWPSQLR